jgi:tetratricopeptide (TPR) repeat protein
MTFIAANSLGQVVAGCLAFTSALMGAPTENAVHSAEIPRILLVAPADSTPLDAQIRTCQLRLARTATRGAELERLGWLFIAKARASSDPGYNTLAAVAAETLENTFDLPHAAWLLRGHVMQTRHRFAEAEELGRRLVDARGSPTDFALLGDALYDRGKIDEASTAYQRMIDLKPSLDSYARAANIRWIKGDLSGAIELQTLAVRSGGPRDAGALAWSLVRLGHFVWQNGNAEHAQALAARALEVLPEFQPALLLQGRILLSLGREIDALVPLARSAEILPLPESLWIYSEALRAVGRFDEAIAMEDRLVREGLAEDPRTVAVFLATRGRNSDVAMQLASTNSIIVPTS